MTGCPPATDAPASTPPPPPTVIATAGSDAIDEPAAAKTNAPSDAPPTLTADEALREGLVTLEGVVRPTKGGLDLRGVTLALERLKRVLPEESRAVGYDELLGSKLSVVVELEARHGAAAAPDQPAIQARSGDGFVARELREATILEPPVVIEGEVSRSKGLLAVGKHLVTKSDLSWSLRGVDPMGKRVRLWGQPRTHVCHPQAQCLVGGSIPMFDVARAELVE